MITFIINFLTRKQNKKLKQEIKELTKEKNYYKEQINELIRMNNNKNNKIEQYKLIIEELEKTIKQLQEKQYNRNSSLESFKQYLETNVKPTTVLYRFRNKKKPAHESLIDNNTKPYIDFIKNKLKINIDSYDDVESFIFNLVKKFYERFPLWKYYKSDKSNYGNFEWWEEPRKVLDKFNNGVGDDCDGHGTLLYKLIQSVIKEKFPNEEWRLRAFVVKTITGEGHYILAWVKEGVNDWVPIETTWFRNTFFRAWNEGLTLRSQLAYKIMFSFDDKAEYVKE